MDFLNKIIIVKALKYILFILTPWVSGNRLLKKPCFYNSKSNLLTFSIIIIIIIKFNKKVHSL